MKNKIDKIAKELRTALKKSVKDFKGLYVFGSQTSGKSTQNSDIDVVVLLGNYNLEKLDAVWDIVSFLNYKYGVVIDLQPMTKRELKRNYIFNNEVVNKGIFYAAA